ncbi:hypothetical protein SLH46_03235 [Draconibacterium sp. IB214405]|uniref:hypothetical protein n=1 Tax=Draconibacterium sp. IB214405 TaxID=3097352 RepID=UPI002A133DDE|nr:hypothetical protein [Draconibacterium sp. IB214405]MDX8338182.1 hypothetical protein [Draconibacterium sp. IB214405]
MQQKPKVIEYTNTYITNYVTIKHSIKTLIVMKHFNIKRNKWIKRIFTISIIILTVIVGMNHRNNGKSEKENLLKNGLFAIGEIIDYSSPKSALAAPNVSSTGKPAELQFSVRINEQEYICDYDEWSGEIPHEGIEVGNKYLVLYPKDFSSKEFRMQFDYPIKDSTDFKRYVVEFEKRREEKNKRIE